METLCELKVKNLKDATVVVASRILSAKETKVVPFKSVSQLQGALIAEKREIIKLETAIPKEVKDKYPQLKGKQEPVELNEKEELTVKDHTREKQHDLNTESGNEAMAQLAESEEEAVGYEHRHNPQEDANPIVNHTELNEGIAKEMLENAEEAKAQEGLPSKSRTEIIDMTLKEMKEFVSSNDNVEIDKYSKMNSSELTNALLDLYGYDKLSGDEK